MVKVTKPKTLLDGYGEASEQVVALRAEVERMRDVVFETQRERQDALDAQRRAEAERDELRAQLETCQGAYGMLRAATRKARP